MLQCPPIANNTIVQEYDDEGTDGGDLNFAGEEEQEVRRMQPTCQGTVESVHCVGMIGVQYVPCDLLKKNPAHPTKIDLHVHVVLEAIIVTKETF